MNHGSRCLAFWLLLPLSALQGLWLRRNAIRLPEASGARTGVCGQGEKLQLLAMGDSIIAGVGTGSTRYWRSQVNQLVAELREKWPQAKVIFAGLPPMGQFPLPPQPLRFTLGQRAATLDAIAAGIIARQAGMLHIPTDINPLEQEFCEDGFHPSAESCAYWAKVLAQRFEADNLDLSAASTGST